MTDNRKDIERMLDNFAENGFEKPRRGLLQEIKDRIPVRLASHRLDTINIIVDLRINRVAAAAAIVFVVILAGAYFGVRDMMNDGASVIRYALDGEEISRAKTLDNLSQFLTSQGRQVIYSANREALKDPDTILMFWRQDPNEGTYGVIFGDLSTRVVNGEELMDLLKTRVLAISEESAAVDNRSISTSTDGKAPDAQ